LGPISNRNLINEVCGDYSDLVETLSLSQDHDGGKFVIPVSFGVFKRDQQAILLGYLS